MMELRFVRRSFDTARTAAKLRDDHTVDQGNAVRSAEPEGVIRTTDRGHLALGPFRTVVRPLGNVSRLRESGGRLRSSFARPWFPASGTVADTVVNNGRQHHINQRRAILWPGRFNLWSEGR